MRLDAATQRKLGPGFRRVDERGVSIPGFLKLWLRDVKPKGSLALTVDVDPYNFL